ncbi:MAG: cation:proton antiporter [Bacteroidetes bacterium]|nr:cation:proton antiporter [Bacteroidota bacterium]
MILLATFLLLVLLYGIFSKTIERSVLTAPIIFTAMGMLMVVVMPELRDRKAEGQDILLRVAEIGLVLLLFSDASGVGLRLLRSVRSLPIRLLSTGMLLTILLGAVGAMVVFPSMSIWEAGILAAILAPTDAGLGQVIVKSPLVPKVIREALNVEAGLNDGLSVPFLLFFIAMAGDASGAASVHLWKFIVEQLGYGTLVGIVIGGAGGVLIGRAVARGRMVEAWKQLAVVALPLLCMMVADGVGASMFIAAFVAGLAVQGGYAEASKHSVEFTEQWGQLFNLSVFFLFGILVMRAVPHFTIMHVFYAVISLTVVRMVPVAIALIGTRMQRSTVLFMGWFGPRGLASIVLGLVYLELQQGDAANATIKYAVMITVFISIVAHGLSAKPGASRYARAMALLSKDAPELQEQGRSAA